LLASAGRRTTHVTIKADKTQPLPHRRPHVRPSSDTTILQRLHQHRLLFGVRHPRPPHTPTPAPPAPPTIRLLLPSHAAYAGSMLRVRWSGQIRSARSPLSPPLFSEDAGPGSCSSVSGGRQGQGRERGVVGEEARERARRGRGRGKGESEEWSRWGSGQGRERGVVEVGVGAE